MFIDAYHASAGAGIVHIAPEQASRFAREIAGDFNPIHDPDARRFCVPGDLLFALVLRYYGLSSSMSVSFRGMVGHDASLIFPETDTGAVQIADRAGNVYLEMERSGAILDDPSITEAFIRRYAAFSGRNFPEFLEPLMRQQGVMFNPSRPMVLYDSMTFSLQAAPSPGLDMEISDASLDVAGRRADEWLHFRISDGDRPVGTGSKKVVISGLQPWDEARMQAFIHDYAARRDGQPA